MRVGARAASAVSHQAPRLLGKAGVSSSRALTQAPSHHSCQTAEPVGGASDGEMSLASASLASANSSSSHSAAPLKIPLGVQYRCIAPLAVV